MQIKSGNLFGIWNGSDLKEKSKEPWKSKAHERAKKKGEELKPSATLPEKRKRCKGRAFRSGLEKVV